MNNPAKQDDMPTSDHLADREISRVLSALKKAGFKKSETGNAAPDQTFKPRSLMEIAAAARETTQRCKWRLAAVDPLAAGHHAHDLEALYRVVLSGKI